VLILTFSTLITENKGACELDYCLPLSLTSGLHSWSTGGFIKMKINKKIRFFRIATVGLIGLGMGLVPSSARADQWDKKTILTINEPMQVRDTVLPPGQYVFKLLDSQSDRHIVQIFNYDQSRIIDTQLAIPNYRLQPTGHSRFSFWETPEGSTKALRAWFYPGDNFGQEFPYPKHLAMAKTASASVSYRGVQPEPAAAPEAVAVEAPAPVREPETVAALEAPQPVTETAPAAEDAPQAAAPEQARDTVLPKTASSYPLFGLAGLLSLGAFGLLRRKSVDGN
jgi:LPXTG-motif cell wall-anchored protein